MVSINGLTVSFSGTPLFDDVSFLINSGERVGLTGKNGAGKSTLLKVISGQQSYDKGNIAIPKDTTVGYLPQQMIVSDLKTVYDETITAFAELLGLEKDIEEINLEIVNRTDYESDEYLDLINKLTEKTDRFSILGGNKIEAEVERALIGLGFLRTDFTRPTKEFSGGWRMRIELAKILLQKPDVLLLDEPTNHLDIESVQWFEEELKSYDGAVVVVSHDKAFLDNLTTRTIEISFGKIYDYKVSYSKYLQQREELLEQQKASYLNQQKKIEEIEQFIERFRYKASKSVQVQSRIKQLDKIERIEFDEIDKTAIHFRFPPAPHSGKIIVEAKEISKRFGEHLVLNELDFVLEKGQKVAFVGKNGEGKTTFSKIIVGLHECEGSLKIGHGVKIGYYAQNQSEMLSDDKTVFQTIDEIAVGEVRTKIRDILASFLFRGEEADKKVRVLSGGEKARLSLAKLLLEPANLLVLDEPTNHLDMRSKDILKQALLNFDGSLILVSHDRDFLSGISDTVYEFKNKKIKQHLGGVADFLAKKKIETFNQLNITSSKLEKSKYKEDNNNKLKYEERKELDKIIRKAQKLVDESETKIVNLETEIDKMNEVLSNPENIEDSSVFDKYQGLKDDLDKEFQSWEDYNKQLEDLLNKK